MGFGRSEVVIIYPDIIPESATSAKLDTDVKTPWWCRPHVGCTCSRLWFLMFNFAIVSTEQNISNKKYPWTKWLMIPGWNVCIYRYTHRCVYVMYIYIYIIKTCEKHPEHLQNIACVSTLQMLGQVKKIDIPEWMFQMKNHPEFAGPYSLRHPI